MQVLCGESGLDPLPPALSGLSRLRLCHLECWGRLAEGATYAPPLPGGPWLRSLQWLSVGPGTLLSSTAVLQGAAALECVSIANSPTTSVDWHSPAADAFFDWLARHPPLRRLAVDCSSWPSNSKQAFASTDFVVQMTHLCRRRPALLVQYPGFSHREQAKTFLHHLRSESHPF